MNAYSTIVLLSIVLFFVVWALGWVLERLSRTQLDVTRNPGSRAWYVLVGPGVALHESSHALGCVFTRTPIVEFKPLNVQVQDNYVVLGYVKYRNPDSSFKRAVINLAPIGVSLVLLVLFAAGATYLVPGSPGIGGQALTLLQDLINIKSNPVLLADTIYPALRIGGFVYLFLYTLASLTVINPIFWIVAFLAMTIMFSNAPSNVDISNAKTGLEVIVGFDLIWLIVSILMPETGWLLPGLFELLAVMFTLALAFAGVAYGFFFMITAMAKLRTPANLVPLIACLLTGACLWYKGYTDPTFLTIMSPAMQTLVSLLVFALLALILLPIRFLRARR